MDDGVGDVDVRRPPGCPWIADSLAQNLALGSTETAVNPCSARRLGRSPPHWALDVYSSPVVERSAERSRRYSVWQISLSISSTRSVRCIFIEQACRLPGRPPFRRPLGDVGLDFQFRRRLWLISGAGQQRHRPARSKDNEPLFAYLAGMPAEIRKDEDEAHELFPEMVLPPQRRLPHELGILRAMLLRCLGRLRANHGWAG